jgi:hypothetical protein
MDRDLIIGKAFTRRKRVVLEYAREVGSDAEAYGFFEVPMSSFYRWRPTYARKGEAGLVRKQPIAKSHPRQPSSTGNERAARAALTERDLSKTSRYDEAA